MTAYNNDFARMMHGVLRWYRQSPNANDDFPPRLTLEVGNVDIAADLLHALKREMESLLMPRDGNTLAIDLNQPFRYMGFIVEIKLRPAAPK